MNNNMRKKLYFLCYSFGAVLLIRHSALLTEAADDGLVFPDYYEEKSGAVTYNCEIILPQNFDVGNFYAANVEGVYCSDYALALELIAEGRAVLDETIYPAEGDIPEWRYYNFEDGSVLGTGDTTFFVTQNSFHYASAFTRLSEKSSDQEQMPLKFSDAEECEKKIVDLMHGIGLAGEISFGYYALGHEEACAWEEHFDQNGESDEASYKQEWTEKDDAYLFYGYQEFQGIPVYHELMFLGGSMKYMNADNAAVQAIYTAGGIEKLQVNYTYILAVSDEYVSLKPFDDIADTINNKLNNIIGNMQYEIKSATLVQLVKHSQSQTYETMPVWYVETVSENGISVILVNASTAEEVFVR